MKLELQEKYIAFLDVLGFSRLVESAKTEELEIYFNTVQNAFDSLKIEQEGIQKLMVSDSIILIAPNNKDRFKLLIRAILNLQIFLLKEKILLRGAISKGQVHYKEDERIIVGKGFIKAFKLESQAIFPRVIIDPGIIKDIAPNRMTFLLEMSFIYSGEIINKTPLIYANTSKITSISEDAIFVNYIERYIYTACHNLNRVQDMEFLYEFIKDNLYSSQETYSKYLWLKTYIIDILTTYKINHSSDELGNYFEKWETDFSLL